MTSTVLELAISLMLLYLIISGFCSALQEFVANTLRWRSKTLEQALGKLLRDPDAAKKIYGHALAAGLWSPAWIRKDNPRKPSYIPTDTFARILLDLHQGDKLAASSLEVVKALVQGVETDFAKQRAAVEKWFDDSMARVSGWYKRKAHAWLWLIAVVVCAVLNADTIGLARLLWNDEALRQSVVTAATTYVKENKKPTADAAKDKDQKPAAEPAATATLADDAKKTASDAGNSGSATESKAFENLKTARTELDKSGIPLGWCWGKVNLQDNQKTLEKSKCWPLGGTALGVEDPRLISVPDPGPMREDCIAAWLLRIAGILITALAVSQGAPFWFDLLQKAVNLRLSGAKPPAGTGAAK